MIESRITNGLLNRIDWSWKAAPSSPFETSTLHKVILVAALILTLGFVVVKAVPYLFSARSTPYFSNSKITPSPPLQVERSPTQITELSVVSRIEREGIPFPLMELPTEVIISIFSFVSPSELSTLQLVSKDVAQLANVNFLWKPRVTRMWGESDLEEGKSWKQIYQERYEGPLSGLVHSCFVQNYEGRKEPIHFGDRSRVRHLKWRICRLYGLPLATKITLMAKGATLIDDVLMRGLVQSEDSRKSVYNSSLVINFIVSPQADSLRTPTQRV